VVSLACILACHGQAAAQQWKLALPLQAKAQPVQPGQPAPPRKLNIVIVEGDGALNNLRQRVAREPIVQVEDENRKPVGGALVTFLLPNDGAGATFPNGSRTLTVTTDNQGRAAARGLRPNNVEGKFEIRVNASHEGQTATTVITQTNALAAAGAVAAGAGISAKLIAILAVAGAAAVGGTAYALTRNGNNTTNGPVTPPASVLTPGTPSVGPPR
jgi:hypothetical protein